MYSIALFSNNVFIEFGGLKKKLCRYKVVAYSFFKRVL